MSLKKNICANYVSQLYVALIGIIMVPIYIRYMGAEAYGLAGFFLMLQAWFQLLDMGLTPTMSRETARFRGGATTALHLRRLLRALEGIFLAVALLGATALIIESDFVSRHWLKVQQLSLDEVRNSLVLIALIVALRWIGDLYRGTINGFESQIWLSGFNILVSTVRFVLIIPFLVYVNASPSYFFGYQLAVAIAEAAVLVIKTYRLLPAVDANQHVTWEWAPLRGILKFSLTIAFTSSVWVLLTQTDKLLLSKLLPLKHYAYFTLAVLAASGVTFISGPISSALLPRMAKLVAEGDEEGLIRLYRNATQFVAIVVTPVTLILAFFAEQILRAWIGDAGIAHEAAPVLTLYAAGNGILALAAFPYYLQYAKGDLKLHLIGVILFVVIFIPVLLFAIWKSGMIGAGYAWLISNLVLFLFWLPVVHRRFVKGLHMRWLLHDVVATIGIPIAIAFLMQERMNWPTERWMVMVQIIALGLSLSAVAAGCSSWIRELLKEKYKCALRIKRYEQ